MSGTMQGPLIWIVKRHAVNPANIIEVFHGVGGEVQVTFDGGRQMEFREDDLTAEGRQLLLPPEAAVEAYARELSLH